MAYTGSVLLQIIWREVDRRNDCLLMHNGTTAIETIMVMRNRVFAFSLPARRVSMICGCGEQYQMVFPATIAFSIQLSRDPTATGVEWKESRLVICLACGDIIGRVPDAELQVFRSASGGPSSDWQLEQ